MKCLRRKQNACHKSSMENGACFYLCTCRLSRNFFVKVLEHHFEYNGNDEDFLCSNASIIATKAGADGPTTEDVLSDIKKQRAEREKEPTSALSRAQAIREQYVRLHQEVYTLDRSRFLAPGFGDLISAFRACRDAPTAINTCVSELVTRGLLTPIRKGLWTFSLFTEEFCRLFEEELSHFEGSGLPPARPNTMNRHGIIVGEMGFKEEMFDPVMQDLNEMAPKLFPFRTDIMDSYRAFTVQYDFTKDGDRELALHYDNSEVTLNVNIGGEWEGGQVKFFGPADEPEDPSLETSVTLKRGCGVLHAGIDLHQAEPITSGRRHNLIFWFRSSEVRNGRCPMCFQPPKVLPTNCYADEGFRF